MAEVIAKTKIKEGHLFKVVNTERGRFSNASRTYYGMHCEFVGEELPILMTSREHTKCRERTGGMVMQVFDDISLGHVMYAMKYLIVRCQAIDGKTDGTYYLVMTKSELTRFINRAKKNPEDIPHKGFITDIFD